MEQLPGKMSFVCSTTFVIRTVASDWIRRSRCYVTVDVARPRLTVRALANRSRGKLVGLNCSRQNYLTRTFSSSSTEEYSKSSNNDEFYLEEVRKRLLVLGKSAIVVCLTEHFLDIYPETDALKVANLVSHVTKEILPFSMDLGLPSNESLSVRRAKMYVEVGKMITEKGKKFTGDEIKNYIKGRYSNSEIETYSKLAHPAPLLKSIVLRLGKQLEVRKVGRNKVKVFIDELPISEAKASTYEKAEYNACLAVVREKFMDEVANSTLEAEEEVLIREFKGKFDGQRVVELKKAAADDTFGIYLKGGEKATKQTEKFWEFNYIEPIFINKIVEGSPADTCGRLQEGDVLLAVGDFTLNGITLKSAVSMINEENDVTLTVKYDPEVKLRNKIKEEFNAMENRAFKETLKLERWGKWHEAQAEKNPDKYLKVK